MGKILDVRRKFKGFDLAFEGFYLLGAYHPTKNNGCFSGTNRLGLPDETFRFTGGSANAENINIVIFHIWINSLRKAHPQYIVVTLLRLYGSEKGNLF